MARPRKVSDEEVFAAAHLVITRTGPSDVTLAEIAREAGVTAGALVHRFGSKRDLLLALMEAFAGGQDGFFTGLRAAAPSALEALYAYGDCMAGMGASPGALAHNLAYLQLDLTDPDFHRHARSQALAARAGLEKIVREAVEAGELAPTVSPEGLARSVEVTVSGSLMTWALHQDDTARASVRRDLEALFRPYLA